MTTFIGPALWTVVLAGIAIAPFAAGGFTITLLNYVGIYALVTLGLVLMTGVGGLTSFGQAAFVGIAAYTTAWLTTVHGWSPWLGLIVALLITGFVAVILGAVTLHLGGHYLPLSTIAWGIAIYFLFGNLEGLGRHSGITGIPPINIGGLSLLKAELIYWLIWGVLGLSMLLCSNLLDSRQGRAIRSLRGGAAMAESLGVDTFRVRLAVFVLAALLAAVSGWLFAHMQRVVSPAPFDVRQGIEYLLMAMVGGFGYVTGAVIGATIVTFTKSVLQDALPTFTSHSGQLEVVVFGAAFILLLQYARGGVAPFLSLLWKKNPRFPTVATPLVKRALSDVGTTLLEVDCVTKRFGGLVAVDNVGFSLACGEILGLIGPNGAGKSTMLNLITGVLKPDAGHVHFHGREITDLPAREIAHGGIARTFQHVKLLPRMTLLDNTALGVHGRSRGSYLACALRLDRTEEASIQAEAITQLQNVGLGDKLHELAGNLSLGQQRLLEVARALAADPVLIILDEPAAGLRRTEKRALAGLFRTLRDQGATILLVEHDMDFVMSLVDRIVVMDFGRKLAEGSPAEIQASAAVREAYLGGVA